MKNEFSESYGNYAILPQVEMCLAWLTDEAETVALYVLLSFTLCWSLCMLVLAFYLVAIRKKSVQWDQEDDCRTQTALLGSL